jgi:hypothetical protein
MLTRLVNQMMKKLISFLCLLLIFAACKKTTVAPYSSEGTILR